MMEKKEIPEWNLFDRLDEIENLWIEESDDVKKIKQRTYDALLMGLTGIGLALAISIEGKLLDKEMIENNIKRLKNSIMSPDMKNGIIDMLEMVKDKQKLK